MAVPRYPDSGRGHRRGRDSPLQPTAQLASLSQERQLRIGLPPEGKQPFDLAAGRVAIPESGVRLGCEVEAARIREGAPEAARREALEPLDRGERLGVQTRRCAHLGDEVRGGDPHHRPRVTCLEAGELREGTVDVAAPPGEQGRELLRTSARLADEAKAEGSPTMFIAGKPYEGGRKAGDFMRAICAEYQHQPAACADVKPAPKVTATILNDTRCAPCQEIGRLIPQLKQGKVTFDAAPAYEKKPPCPDGFSWAGVTVRPAFVCVTNRWFTAKLTGTFT